MNSAGGSFGPRSGWRSPARSCSATPAHVHLDGERQPCSRRTTRNRSQRPSRKTPRSRATRRWMSPRGRAARGQRRGDPDQHRGATVRSRVALLVPLLAALLGLANAFRMRKLPDPAPSSSAEGTLPWGDASPEVDRTRRDRVEPRPRLAKAARTCQTSRGRSRSRRPLGRSRSRHRLARGPPRRSITATPESPSLSLAPTPTSSSPSGNPERPPGLPRSLADPDRAGVPIAHRLADGEPSETSSTTVPSLTTTVPAVPTEGSSTPSGPGPAALVVIGAIAST